MIRFNRERAKMMSQVRIRRSRGAVSGAALILLGLWGGLAPFVGSYYHFGFTPDAAWAYTTGRLYLSAIPGAVAVVGGLLVVITRSRALGVIGGLLAAIGGAWFIVGSGAMLYLIKRPSINAGTPLFAANPERAYLEMLALFGGVGGLILFFGALACGRMSLITTRDDAPLYADYPDSGTPGGAEYPAPAYPGAGNSGQFPVTQFPDNPTGQFPMSARFPDTSPGQFPTAAGQFPPSSDQFTQPSALPASPDPQSGEPPA
jgi:hypothetical protein